MALRLEPTCFGSLGELVRYLSSLLRSIWQEDGHTHIGQKAQAA